MTETYYDLAILLGILIGWFTFFGTMKFLEYAFWNKFKRYFLMCNDKLKEELTNHMKEIDDNMVALCEKTNTQTFKLMSNRFSDFLNYLRKYYTP